MWKVRLCSFYSNFHLLQVWSPKFALQMKQSLCFSGQTCGFFGIISSCLAFIYFLLVSSMCKWTYKKPCLDKALNPLLSRINAFVLSLFHSLKLMVENKRASTIKGFSGKVTSNIWHLTLGCLLLSGRFILRPLVFQSYLLLRLLLTATCL